MSDDQSFEDIINNQPEGEDAELSNIWEAVEALWQQFYPGHVLTGKGIIVAEFIDPKGEGGRDLRFVASPDMMPWDMQGFLRSASIDVDTMSQAALYEFTDPDDIEDE